MTTALPIPLTPLRSAADRSAWGWLALMLLVSPGVAWAGAALLNLSLVPGPGTAWLWALVCAPLLEEAVFRPLLQQGLQMHGEHWQHQRRARCAQAGQAFTAGWRPALVANGLTALAFAGAHAPAHGWLAMWWIIPSVALGETWRRTGRLWPCVLLHAWFNLSLIWAS